MQEEGGRKMFRMIRVGANYGLVVLITPPDAGPDDEGVKCYVNADWEISGKEAGVFHETTPFGAQMYFTGHADGLGYEKPPEQAFESIEAAALFVKGKREQYFQKPVWERIGLTKEEWKRHEDGD